MTFRESWLEAVAKKDSVLCAGLDPAEFEMGRGDTGLPEGTDKRDWALRYVEAVAPYCAGLKPNGKYWEGEKDESALREVVALAHELGVIVDDRKLADIMETNEAGAFYSGQRGATAVTIAPFAGNMEESANHARKWNLGAITMCLMSNKEYEREKNKLVDVSGNKEGYTQDDFVVFIGDDGRPHVRQFIQLAHDAKAFGLDGVVIGAPSAKNHIKDYEIRDIRRHVGEDMLVLLPGVGAQGGEAGAIWQYFRRDRVIVNVSRALMFPAGQNSGPDDWKRAAEHYRDMLNGLRKAA